MTPAAKILTTALRASFTLIRQEGEGRRPPMPMVRAREAALRRAWASCPDAETVYQQTRDAWEAETQRCATCGGRAAACQAVA